IEIEKESPAFNFNYEVNPVIRRFILFNESPSTLVVQLTIVPKGPNFANFRVPNSIFRVVVRPKTNFCIVALMKLVSSLPWTEYDIHCHMQKMENPTSKYEDSGKKRNASFQIRAIDLANGRGEVVDDRVRVNIQNNPINLIE